MAGFNLAALQRRSVSAVLLGFPSFVIIWMGGALFTALLFVFFALALLEWFRLAQRIEEGSEAFVLTAGVLYLLVGFYSFYLLGQESWDHAAFVLLLLVVGSDIGAYFSGKLIGGAKMLEVVSPNKTWAGFGGALLGPLLVGFFCFLFGLHIDGFLFALLAGPLIGATGQAGDLIVSFAKRRAGVKDTGSLIPGHGGVLDRIDSLLLCGPVFVLISWILSYG